MFVVIPKHGASVLAAALQEPHFDAYDRYDIELSALAGREGPVVDGLYETFGLRREYPGEVVNAGTLAFHPNLGRRIAIIDATGSAQQELARWSMFVAEYSAIAKEVSTRNRTVFLTIVAPEDTDSLPPKDLNLRHRWWWGVLGRLDTMAYVDATVDRSDEDRDVIVEVARFDLDLADHLSRTWDGTILELREQLAAYVRTGGDRVRTGFHLTRHDRRPERPPAELLEAWSVGAVEWWQGLEQHVCCETASDELALPRCVWVAQVRVLFPRIELERRRIGQWVAAHASRVGPAWTGRDFESLEIGPLASLIRESPALRTPTSRRKLVDWLAGARNRLAHGKTIEAVDVRRGLGLIARDRADGDSARSSG